MEKLNAENIETKEDIWLPPRDSNPDMLIQSQNPSVENKGNEELNSVKCGQVRQNPQTRRKQNRNEVP
jgi:hypothetical protein